MGMELPSQSLGYTHLLLLGLLLLLALSRPVAWVRLVVLGGALAGTLLLPARWVGAAWESPPEEMRFAWGFFLSFVSSLGIPFACGAVAVTLLARRSSPPPLRARLGWTLAAYLAGILLSLPVSFNYALAYPLLR